MKLTIKYFGQIAEITKCNEEEIEFSGITISDLRETLYHNYSNLIQKDFQIVQNQELVSNETEITATEIALLPPFAGG